MYMSQDLGSGKVPYLISTARQSGVPFSENTLHPQEEGALRFILCHTDGHRRKRTKYIYDTDNGASAILPC